MTPFLTGMTHAVVTVPSQQDAMASGVRASVALCYGPGDENAISFITLRRHDGIVSWTVPHVQVLENGQNTMQPVFRGALLEKLCHAAARALEHVKRSAGVPQWSTSYRVIGSPEGAPIVEVIQ